MTGVVLRGRTEELATVVATLTEAARSGASSMIILFGEPGIGKTALLRGAADHATRMGFVAGVGKAEEIDQIAPGAPLLLALRSGPHPLLDHSAFTSLATVYDRQLWLIDRLSVVLEEAAEHAPILIAIDDVQWADRLTQFALRVLPGRLAASPLAWVLTSRLAAANVAEELATAAEGLVPVTRVRLEPLEPEDIAELARDRLGVPPNDSIRHVLRGMGGNPFWAVQVLDGLAWRKAHGLAEDDMHVELLDGVRQRLSGVDEQTVDLARLVAVWGRSLPIDTAARLLDVPSPAGVIRAVREAEDNGLLTSSSGDVDFAHDLLRAAVYTDIPASPREALHRRCGRHLLSSTPSALASAAHYRAIAVHGDLEAAQVLEQAAADSAATMPDQAADLARAAFSLVPADHPQWQATGQRTVALLARVQRYAALVSTADRLIASTRDPEAEALLQVESCRALWEMGDCGEVERRVDLAVRSERISGTARARLTAVRALASTRTPSAPTAADAARAALSTGKQLGDELTQRLALHALTEAARNEGRFQSVLDSFTELRSFSDSEYQAEQIRALQHLDRYDEADALLAENRRNAHDDADRVLPSFLYAQIFQDHNLARFDAAEVGAHTLLRLAWEIGSFTHDINARTVLAGIAIYRGNLAEARTMLEPAEAGDEPLDELRATRLRLLRGWLAAAEGDPGRGLHILRPLMAAASSGFHAWSWSPPWMRAFAGIGLTGNDRTFAEDAATVAELGAQRNPGVRTMVGVALQVRGVVSNDVDVLGKAVAVLRDAPRPLLYAQAVADHASALISAGHGAAGERRLGQAARLFERLGTVVDALSGATRYNLARERDEPSRARQRRPTHGPAALTDTERRVVDLITAGYSNRSAAAQLFVSPNTVNTHLRSIFNKLDVRSRMQLANLVRGDPPKYTGA